MRLSQLAFPASASATHRVLWGLVAGYLALAIGAAVSVWWLSDRWWLATTLLFGPRWVLALPLAILIPAVIRWDRLLVLPLLLAALIVAGPVIGLRTGWRAWLHAPDPVRDFRIASFNAMGGRDLRVSPAELLLDWNPDVVAFQECATELAEHLRNLAGWYARANGTLCLLSRYPIDTVYLMPREGFLAAGGAALVATYLIATDRGRIFVTNLHLDTPRSGLERIRSGDLEPGIERLKEKSTLRSIELLRARHWVDSFPPPHLVAGDFNTPPESPIFRSAWGDWNNAFTLAGRGLGGTRLNGWIRARIDHVLADSSWAVIGARIGEDVGSDHAALIADLRHRVRP